MRKQSSARLSTLASKYRKLTGHQLIARTTSTDDADRVAADIRSLAASVTSQDETPTPRPPRRVKDEKATS